MACEQRLELNICKKNFFSLFKMPLRFLSHLSFSLPRSLFSVFTAREKNIKELKKFTVEAKDGGSGR